MDIINNDKFTTWLKASYPSETLLISCEYLDDSLISSLVTNFNLTPNINNIKVYILFKGSSYDFCTNSSEIKALLNLKNLACADIIVKRNTTLNFTGFLIDNASLLTIDYIDNRIVSCINSFNCPYTINSFKSKFLDLFLVSNDIENFYNSLLNDYINHSLNLNNIVLNYVNLIKSNDLTYKSHCLYSTFRDNFKICTSGIPQFSSFENGTYKLTELLIENNNPGFSFLEVGKLLLPNGKKDSAYTKYGENHSKLAESLGLVHITQSTKFRLVYISDLGVKFLKLSELNKILFLKYQIYNIPLIKYLFNICFDNTIDIEEFILDISTLSQSTAKRRCSNIKALINFLIQGSDDIISDIWFNCLANKKTIPNKNVVNYKFTKESYNAVYSIISNRFCNEINYINIDSIYKSIKLYEPTLLKINKIDNSNELSSLLSIMLSDSKFIFNYPIIIKDSSYCIDPFNHFIEFNEIINRHEFFNHFNKVGYNSDVIYKKFVECTKDLIRLDYDTFISKSKFNIKSNDICTIKSLLLDLIRENNFITLFDLSTICKLPYIGYEYNHYLLYSIIENYLNNDFKLIYDYSSITYKYKYLFLVEIKSQINNFTDLLIHILRTNYSRFDSVSFSEIESYLIINNIISTSLCKSFIDKTKINIDKLNRLKAL